MENDDRGLNHTLIMDWEISVWPADGFDECVSSSSFEEVHAALTVVATK